MRADSEYTPNYTYRPFPRQRPSLHNPFVVQCIIDALKKSPDYGTVTHLVPGEADSFCATRACTTPNSLIVTSDSDLLLYETGDSGIIFFSDIEFGDCASLQSLIFRPLLISQRLALQGFGIQPISRLAFQLHEKPQRKFQHLLALCRGQADQPAFEIFIEPYKPANAPQIPPPSDLQSLDARLLELLLGYRDSQVPCSPRRLDPFQSNSGKMFLPTLLDNPQRSSCFDPSLPVRQVAYSLMISESCLTPGGVWEFSRLRHDGDRGHYVALLTEEELKTAMNTICTTLASVLEQPQHPTFFWHAVTHQLETNLAMSRGRQGLGELLASRPKLEAKLHGHSSWDLVHFHAQVQACCYSFRMLKQMLSLALHKVSSGSVAQAWPNLEPSLACLPELHDFPDFRATTSFIQYLRPSPVVDRPPNSKRRDCAFHPTNLPQRCHPHERSSTNRFHLFASEP